jgi:hypothetical protein
MIFTASHLIYLAHLGTHLQNDTTSKLTCSFLSSKHIADTSLLTVLANFELRVQFADLNRVELSEVD